MMIARVSAMPAARIEMPSLNCDRRCEVECVPRKRVKEELKDGRGMGGELRDPR